MKYKIINLRFMNGEILAWNDGFWPKKIPALRLGFLYLVMLLGENSPGHLMLIEVGRGT